jgi:hypothetical protein
VLLKSRESVCASCQPTPKWKAAGSNPAGTTILITLFSAIVLPTIRQYQLPSFIRELASAKQMKWRVFAIDAAGKTLDESKFAEVK